MVDLSIEYQHIFQFKLWLLSLRGHWLHLSRRNAYAIAISDEQACREMRPWNWPHVTVILGLLPGTSEVASLCRELERSCSSCLIGKGEESAAMIAVSQLVRSGGRRQQNLRAMPSCTPATSEMLEVSAILGCSANSSLFPFSFLPKIRAFLSVVAVNSTP